VRNVTVETTNDNFVHPSFINTGVMSVFIDEPWQSLQVVSTNGAVVLNKSLNGQSGRVDIQLPGTLRGLFIVRLRKDEKMLSQKVIIE
jgi:hypothetical protein